MINKLNTIKSVLLLLSLTSCTAGVIPTGEVDDQQKDKTTSKTPITIQASINHNTTRADATGEYLFKEGDQIGVSMIVDNQPAVVNVPFTLTNGKWVPKETIYYPDHDKKATLNFYFPYRNDMMPNDDLKGYIFLNTNQDNLGELEQFSTCELADVSESEAPLTINLDLQLIKIYFQVQAGVDYSLNDLQAANLDLTNCFTHAVYNFIPMTFDDFYGLDTINPAGTWTINNEKEVLEGKYCLIFPKTLSDMTEIVHLGDQQFSAIVPTKTLSGENIQAGHAYTFKMAPDNSNRTYSQSTVGIKVSLTDWVYHDSEDVDLIDHKATNGLIVKDLDFTKSRILSVMHDEQEVAILTKELGIDDTSNITVQQIKAYPIINGNIAWGSGLILQQDGTPDAATVYLKSDKTLSSLYVNGGLPIYAEPKVLVDPRNGHTYSLVRIGNLTWTGEDVHEKMTTDYTLLEKVSSIPPNSLNPLYVNCTDNTSYDYYFYPMATISNYNMVPNGWRLPSQTDIINLTKLFNNPECLLRSNSVNNSIESTGLNLNQSGYIKESTHVEEGQFAGLWIASQNNFLLFTIEPNTTGGYTYHLLTNQTERFDFNTSAMPVRWVME